MDTPRVEVAGGTPLQPFKTSEALTRNDVAIKQPGTGLPSHELHRVLGHNVMRDLAADHVPAWQDLD